MKIILCHKDLTNNIRGGVSAIYYNLAKEFSRLGVDVVTVSSFKRNPIKSCDHYFIPYKDIVNYRKEIASFLNKIDFDIVECSSWKAELLEYAKQENHKPIVVRGDLSALCFGDAKEAKTEEQLLNLANYRLAVSRSCLSELEINFGVKIEKTILNGVNSSEFRPKKKGILKSNFPIIKIVWVGKPTIAKGFDLLLDLINIASDNLFFNIVLGNVFVDSQIVFPKRKNIKYYKNLSRREMINLYIKNDVCLSTSRHESFGLAPLEAMACGLPVVVPRSVSSFKEYIRKNIDGFMYNDLKDAIGCIYKAKELDPREITKQASCFSWSKTAKETLKVYKSLLKE